MAFSIPAACTLGCRSNFRMHVELHPRFADTAMGQTAKATKMKKSGGKADPKKIGAVLQAKLG